MAEETIAVLGIYTTDAEAERAVDRLLAAGFRADAISVLRAHPDGSGEPAFEKHDHAPEGAVAGLSAGGVLGGTFGLLAGLGALAIPGVGPFLAIGPLLGALTGLGAGGLLGGLVGTLVGHGVPEYQARHYHGRIQGGGTLLSVHCVTEPDLALARETLQATGAEDISATDEPAPELETSA